MSYAAHTRHHTHTVLMLKNDRPLDSQLGGRPQQLYHYGQALVREVFGADEGQQRVLIGPWHTTAALIREKHTQTS